MVRLPGTLQRFVAAMIVAFGLMIAQPAIASGQHFRVGAAITAIDDDHRRMVPESREPPLPAPGPQGWFVPLAWPVLDAALAPTVAALARGDPSLDPSTRFRAGLLLGNTVQISS